MRTIPALPRRIPVGRNALPALLARRSRLGRYQLRIETDRHGDTVAFLERREILTLK